MSRNQSQPIIFAIRLSGILAMALAVFWSTVAQAQGTPAIQWVQTSLAEPTAQLYTPASGALFVRTAAGLSRSDDGGTSWSSVSLPQAQPIPGVTGWPGTIAVDHTNHTTIYASSWQGAYKTDDDAASWKVILSPDAAFPEVGPIAVSPADNQLVYATLQNRDSNRLRIVRSVDGGGTWETVHDREISVHISCDWAVYMLHPHPTDSNRLFLAATCPRTSSYADLEQSLDRGDTWGMVYKSGLSTPSGLVVAGVTPPGQLLMTLAKDYRGGGSLLTRSLDDGVTWATLLEFSGGGSASGGGPNVGMSGLAVDPIAPNRLLLGINASQRPARLDSQIRLSNDAGATWTEIAPPEFPSISDLAFGIDGRMMFASTTTGVWRAAAP